MEIYPAALEGAQKSILIAAVCPEDIAEHFGDLARAAREHEPEVHAVIAQSGEQRHDIDQAMEDEFEIYDPRRLHYSDSELVAQTSPQDRIPQVIAAKAWLCRAGFLVTYNPDARAKESHRALHLATLAAQKILAAKGVQVPVLALNEHGHNVIMPGQTTQALAA